MENERQENKKGTHTEKENTKNEGLLLRLKTGKMKKKRMKEDEFERRREQPKKKMQKKREEEKKGKEKKIIPEEDNYDNGRRDKF